MCSQEDAEIMAFIADCLEPICAVLFANSPFMNSRPTGTENPRYRIWNDTDSVRCKNLLDHGITSHKNLVKKYSEYLQDVPAIFVLNQEGEFKGFDGTFGEWLSNQEKSGVLQDRDIQLALHQIFTHVRFKHILEVRGSDRPPYGFELAPAAFWTGLLASENTKYEVLEIVKTWTTAERKHLNKTVYKINLDQEGPAGKTIKQWIKTFSSLSVKGLKERADFFGIESESKFLEPFVNDVLSKGPKSIQTQAAYKASGLSIVDFLQRKYQLNPPN
jgi:glutamate--cysteine ligase